MGFFDPFGGSGGGTGMPGKDGRGISTITFLSSSKGSTAGITGATDTYQITYTDGTKTTYVVKNGEQGERGEKGLTGPQGPAGADGAAGSDGADGKDGVTPIFRKTDTSIQVSTDEEQTYHSLVLLSEITGPKGEKGDTGATGKNGRGISSASVSDKGILTLTYTDGTSAELGNVKGADGTSINIIDDLPSIDELPLTGQTKGDGYLINGHLWVYVGSTDTDAVNGFIDAGNIQGPAGRGISTLTIDSNYNLVATYSDSTQQTIGYVRGPQGGQGIQGERGEKGDPAKVRYINTVLETASWNDGTYTLTSEYFQADNYINIGTHKDTTLEQYNALAAAKIICIEQSEGQIVLKSLGLIPSIDTPITIIIEGEQLDTVTNTYLMTDETTGITYKMGINNGTTYFEEYTE